MQSHSNSHDHWSEAEIIWVTSGWLMLVLTRNKTDKSFLELVQLAASPCEQMKEENEPSWARLAGILLKAPICAANGAPARGSISMLCSSSEL